MKYLFPGEKEWIETVAVKQTYNISKKFAKGFIFYHVWLSKFIIKVVLKIL